MRSLRLQQRQRSRICPPGRPRCLHEGKLDENLPESLVQALTKLGHDTDTVRSEGIAGASDTEVWHTAQAAERFLVTQDLDFSDVTRFEPGSHFGLMLVRLRERGSRRLIDCISTAFREQNTDQWARCFVLLTDTKLRVRRPAS